MIPTNPLFHKPKSIIAAKNIFFAVIFLNIIILTINGINSGFRNYSNSQGLFTSIFILGIVFILTRLIGLGRKWARVAFLILFLLEALFLSFTIIPLFNTNMLIGLLIIMQFLLQILALKFLFSLKSTEWFNGVQSTLSR